MHKTVDLITQQKVATLSNVQGIIESDETGKLVLRIVSPAVSGYLKKAFEPGIRQFTSVDAIVKAGARLNISKLEVNPAILKIA